MTTVISAHHLHKSFGGINAVNDVSVSFEEKRLYGLIGPNGAGKSTLINLLSGQLSVDSGIIEYQGRDITQAPPHIRSRKGVGRTFQHTRLTEAMTLLETVISGCLISKRAGILAYLLQIPSTRLKYLSSRGEAQIILELVGLEDLANSMVRELSWADQRLLEIARALALKPKILLLDEPTAGMHVEALPRVAVLLKNLVEQGLSVVVIEHNVPFISNTVNYVYAMDSGSIIADGAPSDVLKSKEVIQSYLGEFHE